MMQIDWMDKTPRTIIYKMLLKDELITKDIFDKLMDELKLYKSS